jgi:acetylornithine/N-succinyldiaminopimelate aminotransferase
MLTTTEIGSSFVVGTHGSTFGGNPLATAVAGKSLEIIHQPAFLADVTRKADRLFEGLAAINERRRLFNAFRGKGLWVGCVLSPEYAGHSKTVIDAALEQGLLGLRAGPDIVRFAPALNIPDEDLEEGLARFERAVDAVRFDG